MLKSVPMYSSGLILCNVVQNRFANDYLAGTFLWIAISTVVVVTLDQIFHNPISKSAKLSPGSCYSEGKLQHRFAAEAVSLLGQSLAYLCGSTAGFALAVYRP